MRRPDRDRFESASRKVPRIFLDAMKGLVGVPRTPGALTDRLVILGYDTLEAQRVPLALCGIVLRDDDLWMSADDVPLERLDPRFDSPGVRAALVVREMTHKLMLRILHRLGPGAKFEWVESLALQELAKIQKRRRR